MAIPVRRRLARKDDDDEEEEDNQRSRLDHRPSVIPSGIPSAIWSHIVKGPSTGLSTSTVVLFTSSTPAPSQGEFNTVMPSASAKSPLSDQVIVATSPAQTATGPNATPTRTGDDNGKNYTAKKDDDESHHGMAYAAAGVVPIVLLVIMGVAIFFFLRKRKRQRQAKALAHSQAQMQEMKTRNQQYVQPNYSSPPPPSAPTQAQYLASPNQASRPSGPANPQPVILGPIPGSNGAYYTGIDTSDGMSVNERTGLGENTTHREGNGLGDPFADGNSVQDEPPPPYRPRSIATLSRDTSMRSNNSGAFHHSQTNLLHHTQAHPYASPFADHHREDDMVSVLSAPARRRHQDTLSVVSDLSYQNDPVVSRPDV